MDLFVVHIGGEAPGATIEVHDMSFIVATTLRDTCRKRR